MTKTTFAAQTPAGTTLTRTSESRTYSHAIIAFDTRTQEWGALTWAGREDLAVKQVAHWTKNGGTGLEQIQMVPAVVVIKSTRKNITDKAAAQVAETITTPEEFATMIETTLAPAAKNAPLDTPRVRQDGSGKSHVPADADLKAKAAKKAPAKKAAAKPTAAKKVAEKKPAADSPERKAERKLVEKRRAAGESWAAIAKDLNMSAMGVRNRYIDLVPAKDAK